MVWVAWVLAVFFIPSPGISAKLPLLLAVRNSPAAGPLTAGMWMVSTTRLSRLDPRPVGGDPRLERRTALVATEQESVGKPFSLAAAGSGTEGDDAQHKQAKKRLPQNQRIVAQWHALAVSVVPTENVASRRAAGTGFRAVLDLGRAARICGQRGR